MNSFRRYIEDVSGQPAGGRGGDLFGGVPRTGSPGSTGPFLKLVSNHPKQLAALLTRAVSSGELDSDPRFKQDVQEAVRQMPAGDGAGNPVGPASTRADALDAQVVRPATDQGGSAGAGFGT